MKKYCCPKFKEEIRGGYICEYDERHIDKQFYVVEDDEGKRLIDEIYFCPFCGVKLDAN